MARRGRVTGRLKYNTSGQRFFISSSAAGEFTSIPRVLGDTAQHDDHKSGFVLFRPSGVLMEPIHAGQRCSMAFQPLVNTSG